MVLPRVVRPDCVWAAWVPRCSRRVVQARRARRGVGAGWSACRPRGRMARVCLVRPAVPRVVDIVRRSRRVRDCRVRPRVTRAQGSNGSVGSLPSSPAGSGGALSAARMLSSMQGSSGSEAHPSVSSATGSDRRRCRLVRLRRCRFRFGWRGCTVLVVALGFRLVVVGGAEDRFGSVVVVDPGLAGVQVRGGKPFDFVAVAHLGSPATVLVDHPVVRPARQPISSTLVLPSSTQSATA